MRACAREFKRVVQPVCGCVSARSEGIWELWVSVAAGEACEGELLRGRGAYMRMLQSNTFTHSGTLDHKNISSAQGQGWDAKQNYNIMYATVGEKQLEFLLKTVCSDASASKSRRQSNDRLVWCLKYQKLNRTLSR